ncbi:MAG TPA: hypothetical protein VI583_04805 [Cyclobacteriaceae bacterium]|nr:hypothetical protein [Cyclobacteriaceae bacterium]
MVVKDGEFIGMENGRVVLLNNQQIIKIRSDQVKLAAVYTHNSSNPGKFTLITLISFLPNLIGAIAYPEYAGPFLRIGIFPLLLPGLIITLAESAKELSVKYYPVDIKYESDLIKYARFPQGIPADFISGFTSRNSQ